MQDVVDCCVFNYVLGKDMSPINDDIITTTEKITLCALSLQRVLFCFVLVSLQVEFFLTPLLLYC